jgi:myo-inositol-1(or 4)-monophosphatase
MRSNGETVIELSRRLEQIAAEAAHSVADQLREAFRSDMHVDYKRDAHDPVTAHDRRAEARIRDVILSREPDSTIIGEEGGAHGHGRVHWYVDPIDGTANFAHGLAFFCTSVGAVVDGEILAGAVFDPIAGQMFTTSLGGARLNGERLSPTGASDEAHALLITSYPSERDLKRDGADVAGVRLAHLVTAYGTVRRCGSAALALCHVAAGWSDATLGVGVNGWDVCAAQLIVRAAGGTYKPFTAGVGETGWDSPGYVAYGPSLDAVTLNATMRELIAGPA